MAEEIQGQNTGLLNPEKSSTFGICKYQHKSENTQKHNYGGLRSPEGF
jgi:hypothetical protein